MSMFNDGQFDGNHKINIEFLNLVYVTALHYGNENTTVLENLYLASMAPFDCPYF